MTKSSIARVGRRLGLGVLALLAVVAIPLFYGAAYRIPRIAHRPPPPSRTYASWDEVFREAPHVSLRSLDTGIVGVDRARMLAASQAESASYPGEPEPLRVYAHLVRHPVHGDVLVDSGLDTSFRTAAYGNIRWPARWILAAMIDAPYTQVAGEAIEDQLAALDAHPRAVFLTHLHMDHTAGLPVLSTLGLTQVITGPSEADDVYQVFGFGHLDGFERIEELDFRDAPELSPPGPAIDLFGDGSFWAVSTPGHSLGHVSFVVVSTEGPVLLTGDATHFRWAFEHDVGPAAPTPEEERIGRESLRRLRDFAAAYPQVTVFTGHEAPR